MNFKLLQKLLLILLLCFLSAESFASKSSFLEIELTGLQGNEATLGAYVGKGRWTVVMLWASDCMICVQEKPKMSDFHDKHKKIDAHVVGVALDGPNNMGAIKQFVSRHKTTFPTLTAEANIILRGFEVSTKEAFIGTPTYLVYTPRGMLVANNPGPISSASLEQFIAKYNKLSN
jgi:peroxiredoxin